MSFTKLICEGREGGFTTCEITISGTKSTVADLKHFVNYGLLIPTIVSGTLTFEVSNLVDGDYYTVKDKDASTDFAIAGSTGDCAIESNDLKVLAGYRYIKIISSTAQDSAAVEFVWTLKG